MHASGVDAGDRVAFLAPNIPELLIAHFAVPLTGAVLVAPNTRLSPDEVRFICDDSGAVMLVADPELLAPLALVLDALTTGRASRPSHPACSTWPSSARRTRRGASDPRRSSRRVPARRSARPNCSSTHAAASPASSPGICRCRWGWSDCGHAEFTDDGERLGGERLIDLEHGNVVDLQFGGFQDCRTAPRPQGRPAEIDARPEQLNRTSR